MNYLNQLETIINHLRYAETCLNDTGHVDSEALDNAMSLLKTTIDLVNSELRAEKNRAKKILGETK